MSSAKILGVALTSAIAVSTLIAATTISTPALANGRFPRAQQLLVQPGNTDRIVLRATYGIVTSPDRGQNWFIMCEGAVGYGDTEDPAIGVSGDGTIFAGIFKGLSLSHDRCDWEFPTDEFGTRFIADVSVERQNPSNVLVIVSAGGAVGGGFINQLWASGDDGRTWQQLGADLDSGLILFTHDPAPSEPNTIYVTARNGDQGLLMRTTDRGQNWQSFDIPGTDMSHNAFIGAVHPTNPDIVYVRVDGEKPNSNPEPGDTKAIRADDFLTVTTDGGQTWTRSMGADARLLGFALSPDGGTVLAGFGDPKNPEVSVDQDALGVFKADTAPVATGGALQFEQILSDPVSCLTWSGNTIYVCGSQFVQGFELGETQGVDFTVNDPSPLTGLLDFDGLGAIEQCGAGTDVATECADTPENICQLLSNCPDGGAAGSGTGGQGTGGGVTGSGGSGGVGVDDDGTAGDSGGCSCRAPAKGSAASVGALVLMLGGVALAVRRRRRG